MEVQSTENQAQRPITINGLEVRPQEMFRVVNGKKALLNGFRLIPKMYSRVETEGGRQPYWLSETTVIYASGSNLLRYDFVTGECHCLRRDHQQQEVVWMTVYYKGTQQGMLAYVAKIDNFYYKVVVQQQPGSFHPDLLTTTKVQSLTIKDSVRKLMNIALLTQNNKVVTLSVISLVLKDTIYSQDLENGCCDVLVTSDPLVLMLVRRDTLQYIRYGRGLDAEILEVIAIPQNTLRLHELSSENLLAASLRLLIQLESQLIILEGTNRKLIRLWKFDEPIIDVDCRHKTIAVCTQGSPIIHLFHGTNHEQVDLSDWLAGMLNVRLSPNNQNLLLFCLNRSGRSEVLFLSIALYESYRNHIKHPLSRSPLRLTKGPVSEVCVRWTYEQPLVLLDSCVSTLSNTQLGHVQAATCMAVHPHGLMLLVGYQYCFRIHIIHNESMSVLHTQPASRLLAAHFTGYGNMFAVLMRTQLRLYDSYSFELRLQYESPQKNGELLHMDVNPEGTTMIVVDASRVVHFFDIMLLHKTREFRLPHDHKFLAYDYLYDMFALKQRHQLTFLRTLNAFEASTSYADNAVISVLCVCRELSAAFIGLEDGRIRCHRWPPIDPADFINNYTEVEVFRWNVEKIRLSPDRKTMYAASRFGNLCTLELQIYEDGLQLYNEMRLQRLKAHGMGFYRYYLEGLVVDSRSEMQHRFHEIEDVREHCAVRMKDTREELITLPEVHQEQLKKGTDFVNERYNNRLKSLDERSTEVSLQNSKARQLRHDLNNLEDREYEQVLAYHGSYLPLVQRNIALEEQLLRLKRKYQQEIEDYRSKVSIELQRISDELQNDPHTKSFEEYLGTMSTTSTNKAQSALIAELQAPSDLVTALQNILSNERNRQICLMKSIRQFTDQIDGLQHTLCLMNSDVEQMTAEYSRAEKYHQQRQQQLAALQVEFNRVASYDSFEMMSLGLDLNLQSVMQYKADSVVVARKRELKELGEYNEQLASQTLAVREDLVKEAHSKKKLVGSITALSTKKDKLKSNLQRLRQQCHLVQYRCKQEQEALKQQQASKEELLLTSQQRRRMRQPVVSCKKSQEDLACKLQAGSRLYGRNALLKHRNDDFAGYTKKKMETHLKENEDLLQRVNELTVDTKSTVHLYCHYHTLPTQPTVKPASLYQQPPQISTKVLHRLKGKPLPFQTYLTENSNPLGKRRPKRARQQFNTESQNNCDSTLSLHGRGHSHAQLERSGPMHAPNIDTLTSFPNL